MKKREFQKKAAAALLGKLADVVMELEENPNITITSEYHSSYFKLRKNYNLIQISVKQTGELTYQLTDMLGNTGGFSFFLQKIPRPAHPADFPSPQQKTGTVHAVPVFGCLYS